ncbi:GntR family transcriptional regulator [Bacillus haynesii]|uniref:GntR family transcriptional regulator n=1 Tax=Bacillus haynesii TaxID=1925021 RepID=UPI0022809981|nr:GntR family transcriptional regulator [Bacillus haynesii]MCY8613633.1 GntR family transcriptional regulator [Bacillus haynesii]
MSELPKYSMVKNKIKSWIYEGKVKPGEKIHSENELMKIFNVSRHTIRQAIGDLVHEGLLYREQGSGTYCSHRLQLSEKGRERNKMIGVIATYLSDYIFPSIIRGIESSLSSAGYTLVVASTNNDIEKEKQCLVNMLDKKIDGLIVEPTKTGSFNPNLNYYLTLEQHHIPYLMINQFYQELNPPHFILDDEHGGFIATEHLIKLGHEKLFGFFKQDDMQGVNRMKGFIRAFRENGLSFYPEMVVTYTTENKKEKTIAEARKRLSSTDRPTAIFCYNDEIALMVLDVVREFGLKVPEDISIVGYDDSHLSEASEVKLTSVTHPKMKMGIEAAKWMIAKVEGRNTDQLEHSTVYKPELIVRHSTAKLKR